MKNNKTILFILDSFELYTSLRQNIWPKKVFCYSYFDTEEAINNNIQHIVTYDIGHISFDLEELGYDIFIGYNGSTKQFKSGMSTKNGKELRFGHNLRKLLISGALDNDLKIDRTRKAFWYDKSKSTSDLCEDERKNKKNIFLLHQSRSNTYKI